MQDTEEDIFILMEFYFFLIYSFKPLSYIDMSSVNIYLIEKKINVRLDRTRALATEYH